jgi:NADPH:quinone reductase-like Zn-dependent oxidoreductase
VDKIPSSQGRKAPTKTGIYLDVRIDLGDRSDMPQAADLTFLRELIEAEESRPVIDRRCPLEQIAEAHRYVEKGHKEGHVVIALEHSSN